MLNFPAVASETRLARNSMPPYRASRLFGQLSAMRQETADVCARALPGAAVAVPAASATPAFFRKDRRFMAELLEGEIQKQKPRRAGLFSSCAAIRQPFLPEPRCAVRCALTMKLSWRPSVIENHCTCSARNFFQGSYTFLNLAFFAAISS